MPSPELSNRLQKAVLWSFSGYDAYGQPAVSSTPIELHVRVQDGESEAQDPQGNTHTIDGTVVVDRIIELGSILWIGALADLPMDGSPMDLLHVKTFNGTPDLKNRVSQRMVGIMRYKGTLPGVT